MKTIILSGYGTTKTLELQQTKKPKLKANQVLVKVINSSVNPVDWKIRRGELKLFSGWKIPRKLGADFSGIVESTASDSKFEPGDQVFGFVDPLVGGAYSEYVAVPEQCLTWKPKNLRFDQAAVVPLAGLTAWQGLVDLGNLASGKSVLINGASGGVGTFAIQISKALKAEVTGVTSSKNVDLVKQLGADFVFDYTKDNFNCLEKKYDLIFDAVGKKSYKQCQKNLKTKGIYVSTLPTFQHLCSVIITAFFYPKAKLVVVKSREEQLNILKQLIENNLLFPVIDKKFNLSEIAKAHSYSETGRVVGKIALSIDN